MDLLLLNYSCTNICVIFMCVTDQTRETLLHSRPGGGFAGENFIYI